MKDDPSHFAITGPFPAPNYCLKTSLPCLAALILYLYDRREAVEIINSCYPEEIVKYYSPEYNKQLLEKLDSLAAASS